jgi:hypothetical protein
MSVPYDRKGKRSAALAFGGLGAVIGAALGALIAGPGSGFMGAIPGAIGAALGGALFGLWFDRNAYPPSRRGVSRSRRRQRLVRG